MAACSKPHAVIVPLPAQGHVNPMMQLAKKLVEDGFIITFVNTDFNHARIVEAKKKMKSPPPQEEGTDIRMVSIPDGLSPHESRIDFPKVYRTLENTARPRLHKLIHDINETEEHKVTCLIADMNCAWALDVAEEYGIPRAAFWPAQISTYAIISNCPSLISSGILTSKGVPKERKMVKCLRSMPLLHTAHIPWIIGTEADQESLFHSVAILHMERIRKIEWVIFNSFYDLEAPIINTFPNGVGIYPIGPLIPTNILNGKSENKWEVGPGFWTEEHECLNWLDKQSPYSVIYVSFGSLTIFNARQLEELALGLEATLRPFLWVLRSDLMDGTTAVLPQGFNERIKDRGFMSVLSHPSIACFVTHCGWNSTLESISMGVPMICWPYFADQFLNRSYVVEVWKIGLALNANKDEIIEKGEIEEAVKRLLAEEEGIVIKKRAMKLKESARESVKEGGLSSINYKSFINAMKNN
eukprot:Gb_00346 [translate_table: standard]